MRHFQIQNEIENQFAEKFAVYVIENHLPEGENIVLEEFDPDRLFFTLEGTEYFIRMWSIREKKNGAEIRYTLFSEHDSIGEGIYKIDDEKEKS